MRWPKFILVFLSLFIAQVALANPYWDPDKVPKDSNYLNSNHHKINVADLKTVTKQEAVDVLRIQVDWIDENDTYAVSNLVIEPSGTSALLARSTHKPKWGSYLGVLKDNVTGDTLCILIQ